LDAPSIVGIEEPLTRPPKTWQEVKKTLEGLGEEQTDEAHEPSFCLCNEAWAHLERNPFAYPEWMEESLIKLSKLAKQWADAKGRVGDFSRWARQEEGLDVVMKDAGLRVHKPHLIQSFFDGNEYVAEAHVKLQARRKVGAAKRERQDLLRARQRELALCRASHRSEAGVSGRGSRSRGECNVSSDLVVPVLVSCSA
jgi:hypothetical protein